MKDQYDNKSIKSKIRLVFTPSIFGWQYDISLWIALSCIVIIMFETCKLLVTTTIQMIQTNSFGSPHLDILFNDNFFGIPTWIFFIIGGITGFIVIFGVRE